MDSRMSGTIQRNERCVRYRERTIGTVLIAVVYLIAEGEALDIFRVLLGHEQRTGQIVRDHIALHGQTCEWRMRARSRFQVELTSPGGYGQSRHLDLYRRSSPAGAVLGPTRGGYGLIVFDERERVRRGSDVVHRVVEILDEIIGQCEGALQIRLQRSRIGHF